MKKRIMAVCIATGLVLMGFVSATPAAAHTGDLKVTVSCVKETGEYELTPTLVLTQTNLAGSTKWRVGTPSFEGTPNSDTGLDRGPIASSGPATLTLESFRLPGTTTGLGPWVYAHTTWSDGFHKGSDGQLTTALKGDCKRDKPTEPPVKEVPGSETLPPNCESELVVTKHWLDKTSYEFDKDKWDYVGTIVRINLPDTSVPLTDEQAKECAGDQPEDKVVISNEVKGEVKCGETERTDTYTQTLTPSVREGTKWVDGTPVITTETVIVHLPPGSVKACPSEYAGDSLAITGIREDLTAAAWWTAGILLLAGLGLLVFRRRTVRG